MTTTNLLLRVASLAFEQNKNFGEIADELTADRTFEKRSTALKKVPELVEEAGRWLLGRERQRSTTEADNPSRKIESLLCARYGLLAARVTPGGEDLSAGAFLTRMREYGLAAAGYFDEFANQAELRSDDIHVAVSGGQTIMETMFSLPERKRPNVHFHAAALVGRSRATKTGYVSPDVNATIGWSRSGRFHLNLHYGTIQPFDPEFYVQGKNYDSNRMSVVQQVWNLVDYRPIQETLEYSARKTNAAFASLGLVDVSEAEREAGANHVERLTLAPLLVSQLIDPQIFLNEGAVGELSYNFFDKDGNQQEDWRVFITIGEGKKSGGLDFYKYLVDRDSPVIVAAGTKQWKALLPAIKGKLFNVLVTDISTANRLLKV